MGTTPRGKFLDAKQVSFDDLMEYFHEIELENGVLGLELFVDQDYHTCCLALIETNIPYGAEIKEQVFLNLVDDFIEHVRTLPLADISDREGALWTDEDIKQGYSEAANKWHLDALQTAAGGWLLAMQNFSEKSDDSSIIDDVPF